MQRQKYLYYPIGYDRFDPKVIAGKPIAEGAEVEITGDVGDPRHWFVYIKDDKGNEMSVFKKSLDKKK